MSELESDRRTESERHVMEKQFSEHGSKDMAGNERQRNGGLYFLDETCSVCEQGMNEEEDEGRQRKRLQHMRHMHPPFVVKREEKFTD